MNQGTLQSLLVEDADKKRLEELRAFVIYHNHRYHTLDAPEITDDEYNAAFQELLRLEERHPEWRSPDSPTNRIGGQVLSSLETKAHTRPRVLRNTPELFCRLRTCRSLRCS